MPAGSGTGGFFSVHHGTIPVAWAHKPDGLKRLDDGGSSSLLSSARAGGGAGEDVKRAREVFMEAMVHVSEVARDGSGAENPFDPRTSGTGSYVLREYDANRELKRLQRQVDVVRALELAELRRLGLSAEHRVLDLGCGPGFSLETLGAVGCRVVGLDVDPEMVQLARRRVPRRPGSAVSGGSATALPFRDSSFDVVLARFLFQHLPDPVRVVREVARVLRPGGVFCCLDTDDRDFEFVPEPPGLARLMEAACRSQARRGGNRHVGRELAELAQAGGMEGARLRKVPFTSDQVGMESFLDITLSFKSQIIDSDLMSASSVGRVLGACYDAARQKGAHGRTAGYILEARAPREKKDGVH